MSSTIRASAGNTASAKPVGGGDISAAWRLETDDRPVFVKTGPASSADMFAAEAEGLAELAAPQAIRVPGVLACGLEGATAFLAIEWLDFERPTRDTEVRFGRQLAELHRTTGERHGWHRNNTIGLTPQHNEWSDDWVGFFGRQRLGFQLERAAANGFSGSLQEQGARLLGRLPGGERLDLQRRSLGVRHRLRGRHCRRHRRLRRWQRLQQRWLQ